MLDNHKHKVDQEDGRLNDMLLGLRQVLGRVPPGTLEEQIMDAAVQLAVQLAQVPAPVTLGDAVLLTLVIAVAGHKVVLALAAAQLLQWRFAGDVAWSDQLHNLRTRQFVRPARRKPLCCCPRRRRR